jgi:magnesium-protoporphyrin O-methyltransferase
LADGGWQILSEITICDACGVGSLSIPLAMAGAKSIAASDISDKKWRAKGKNGRSQPWEMLTDTFSAQDLETITGSFITRLFVWMC